jgi:hypothetical protein
MCNLYSMTKGPAAIRDLVKAMTDYTGNLEPLPAIFPDQVAPVVINGPNDRRTMLPMRWGFPQPPARAGDRPQSGYITNVRNTASGWWKPYLRSEFRCLIPVTSFSEYDHQTTPPTVTWFALDDTRGYGEGDAGARQCPCISLSIALVQNIRQVRTNAMAAQGRKAIRCQAWPVLVASISTLTTALRICADPLIARWIKNPSGE